MGDRGRALGSVRRDVSSSLRRRICRGFHLFFAHEAVGHLERVGRGARGGPEAAARVPRVPQGKVAHRGVWSIVVMRELRYAFGSPDLLVLVSRARVQDGGAKRLPECSLEPQGGLRTQSQAAPRTAVHRRDG